MASPTWLLSWWRVFGATGRRTLRSIAFFEGERLVGLAPSSSVSAHLRAGLVVKNAVELLGTGEDEDDEVASDYLGLIVERGRERLVAGAFVDAIGGDAFGEWDELLLARTNGQSPVGILLAEALRARGLTVAFEVVGASFHVPLPASWDAYLAALTPSRRAWLRRSMRAFDKWAGDDVRLEIATTPTELARAKAELVDLHAQRWAGAGRAGAFASSRFSAFHEMAMPALLEDGVLELVSLRARGRTVAALYNLVWRGKVQFYQCGRAVDLGPNVRPGIAIHGRAIAHAIERGFAEYDFLPSLARYKAELSLATRPLVSLRAARPSAFEVARRAAMLVMEHARAIKRSHAARSPEVEEVDS